MTSTFTCCIVYHLLLLLQILHLPHSPFQLHLLLIFLLLSSTASLHQLQAIYFIYWSPYSPPYLYPPAFLCSVSHLTPVISPQSQSHCCSITMAHLSLPLSLLLILLMFQSSVAQPSPGYYPSSKFRPMAFSRGYRNLWGPSHQSVSGKQDLTIWLDKSSGALFFSCSTSSIHFSTPLHF